VAAGSVPVGVLTPEEEAKATLRGAYSRAVIGLLWGVPVQTHTFLMFGMQGVM